MSYIIQGVAALLRRHGWSCQVPASGRSSRRGLRWLAGGGRPGRAWKDRGGARRLARLRGRGRIRDDAADHPQLVRIRGRSRRLVSVAALACYKAGEPSRLIYRPARTPGPADAKASPARPDPDRPPRARRPDRAGLGEPVAALRT
ncbi:hypothetical protein [Streptomyces sp. B3I7]|uniref:hypothetical protein n=1 Tax=Streptomyces sp. B3I7 TaxID=3042269 RepID=UPI00358DDF6A